MTRDEHRAKRIERAARAVIKATWRNLDEKPWPQKYVAPYGALVKLQKAFGPIPSPEKKP